jgi:hypothetical protein
VIFRRISPPARPLILTFPRRRARRERACPEPVEAGRGPRRGKGASVRAAVFSFLDLTDKSEIGSTLDALVPGILVIL